MQRNIKGEQKSLAISEEQAERLLQISRKAKWLFPSSLGRPIAKDNPEWLDSIINNRSLFPEAVKYFLEKDKIDEAYELSANVWRLWVLEHKEKEGRIFLSNLLVKKNFPETRDCALALYGDGLFAYRLGDTAASRECNNQALVIAYKINNKEAQGLALLGLCRVEFSEGNFEQSYKHAVKSLDILKQLGPTFKQGVLNFAAQSAQAIGNLNEAEMLFRQSLELNRKINDETMFTVDLHNLGHVEVQLGKVDEAEKHFNECEKLSDDPNDTYSLAFNLFNKATIAYARNDIKKARLRIKQTREILTENNIVLPIEDETALNKLEKLLID
jgi:tetratricopeptide (TPR) repeat protein